MLLGGEGPALDVRAQVVDPAEAAALAAAEQARLLGQRAPVAVAVALDVRHQDPVLLGRPRTPLQPHLLAARSAPHVSICRRSTSVRSRTPRERGFACRVLARRPSWGACCVSSGCGYLGGVPVVAVAVWTGRGRAGLFIWPTVRRGAATRADGARSRDRKGQNQNVVKAGSFPEGEVFRP